MRKFNKLVKFITIIATAITLISSISYFTPLYKALNIIDKKNTSSSVSIIGGADGPTAIYTTSNISYISITIIFAIISVAGILYLFLSKKFLKNN